MRDVWIVECHGDRFEFAADKKAEAEAYQERLNSEGIASQLSHERHVLFKEPVRWLPGRAQ